MSQFNSCVFTIVSRNYLHYAVNLMASVATYMPDARRIVAICDATDGIPDDLPFEIIGIEQLGIPNLDRLLYQYTILELNTAIKPFVFDHLLSQADSDKVIYFDPDIQLFGSGDGLLQHLDSANIVLTPHLTDFLDDDRNPSEIAIMQSGTYNLGFLALRKSESAHKLIDWWQQKLTRHCVVDIPNGLFTDQKWMDLVPGIFADSIIVRHPGWNVAYWNLKHRHIEQQGDAFFVNGQPLFFFHYSGLDKGSAYISKHQDRFRFTDLNTATRQLFAIYEQSVDASGRERFADFPYAFARLPSGLLLPDIARRYLREHLDWTQPLPDLRSAEGEAFIITMLNTPIDRARPIITALAWDLYQARVDLQNAFPDAAGLHRAAYVDWFIENAAKQMKLDDVFVAPMRPRSDEAAETAAEMPAPATSGHLYKVMYKLAWAGRALVRPFVSEQLRQRIRMRLLRGAYQQDLARQTAADVEASPAGVNVIGYLKSESGVGESSRSMLRALNAVSLPHASVNFHVGNISRQNEALAQESPEGLHYNTNLFHINADQASVAHDFLGDAFYTGRRCIGFWAWELPEFPDDWLGSFRYYDEIWVPSTFCQRAVAAKSPVPVVCIPHTVVIPDAVHPDKSRFGLSENKVSFLSMADMLSIPERKNPLGAVQAFVEAFAGDDGAELLVKLSNTDARPDISQQIRALADAHSNIHLLEGYLERDDIYSLIDSIDCFVSLHRSEGFGLVIAEAMARGKVVVATGWSGNMDFMNTANAMVVDYELIELDQDYPPYKRGQIWADPDIKDAAAKMRRVKEDSELRAAMGARARQDCRALLSDDAVGAIVRQRLVASGAEFVDQ